MKNNCPELSVLILSPNKKVDDQGAAILCGDQELIVKGPLRLTKSVKNPVKNLHMRLLDISNTSITIHGRTILKSFMPNCAILTA